MGHALPSSTFVKLVLPRVKCASGSPAHQHCCRIIGVVLMSNTRSLQCPPRCRDTENAEHKTSFGSNCTTPPMAHQRSPEHPNPSFSTPHSRLNYDGSLDFSSDGHVLGRRDTLQDANVCDVKIKLGDRGRCGTAIAKGNVSGSCTVLHNDIRVPWKFRK